MTSEDGEQRTEDSSTHVLILIVIVIANAERRTPNVQRPTSNYRSLQRSVMASADGSARATLHALRPGNLESNRLNQTIASIIVAPLPPVLRWRGKWPSMCPSLFSKP